MQATYHQVLSYHKCDGHIVGGIKDVDLPVFATPRQQPSVRQHDEREDLTVMSLDGLADAVAACSQT